MNYQGKFSNGSSAGHPGRRPRKLSGKLVILVLALALLSGSVLGTLAYLSAVSDQVTNTFSAGKVTNNPTEEFDGTTKSSIIIENKGNIPVFIRVRLVTYRVDDEGKHIAGEATVPDFTPGTDWFREGDFYYYKNAVAVDGKTSNLLGTSITLRQYTDADGGKQVIEVISESIQSDPTSVVEEAWKKVKVDATGTLSKTEVDTL